MASSSDEGEIIETEAVDLKATSLPKKLDRNGVDRGDRQRHSHSPSRSPEYGGPRPRSSSRRSRSPPRGSKRYRDHPDDGGYRSREDTRRFRVHYEDYDRDRDSQRRSRVSYDDVGSPPRASNHGYDQRERDKHRDRDRDRYPDKRPRNRSRSPYRAPRGDHSREDRIKRDEVRFVQGSDSSRAAHHDDRRAAESRNGEAAGKRAKGDDSRSSQSNAKFVKGSSNTTHQSREDKGQRDDSSALEPAPEAEPEPDFEEPTIFDEEAEIERRRKRRAELLAKSNSATPLLVNAVHAAAEKSAVSSPGLTRQNTPLRGELDTPGSGTGSPSSEGRTGHNAHSPALEIMNETDLINRHAIGEMGDDGPSAADYDPTVDMKEDGIRDERRHGNVGLHGEAVPDSLVPDPESSAQDQRDEKATRDDAGDDDDDFDMFADDFDEEKYAAPKPSKADVVVEDKAAPPLGPPAGGILEGDDKDGYYKIRIGEVMEGRYQVQSMLGKGMFSGVARAVDITSKKLVAIKIMRNNDALRKGGFTEISILQKLNDSDPEGRKHIVKFERHFDYKGHLCMTFENLSLNLREVLRKFGNNVGINLGATRAYAHQIFVGLAHMRKCSIIHADLKPDNILVNESRNVLKICDLGTGIDRSDAATAHNEITPYLVSRFYRAPEIILGMPYDYSIDMWSIGCTLYELYTGKILFTGDSNNQMLKAIMEIRGKFTPKLYKRGQLSSMHFDDLGNFISVERDKVLGKTAVRTLSIVKPTRDLRTRLMAASSGMSDAETRDLNHFIDLLEHCLALNPEKRMKPADALRHPFFTARMNIGKH